MPGIYLHIPFCRQACNYCDFHFSTNIAGKDAVVAAMVEETSLRSSYLANRQVESIYFGGGTPSLLAKNELAQLFEALATYFSWNSNIEITLEANPDDINLQSLSDWKDLGVNRLSIGLQSFDNNELKWMNRAHNAGESLSSVKMAQDKGFGNISIDLIYGSKFQTTDSWENTLKTAIGLDTQHISSYNLTIEQKTALGVSYRKGQEPAVNDELSSQQFLMMLDAFESAGLIQYEISNFGKSGFYAVHNSNYWRQQPYLGLGPSAHSFNGSSRQWNLKNNGQYTKALQAGGSFFEKEELSLKDRYNEYVLTRLRTIWGCDAREISALFGKEICEHFLAQIKEHAHYVTEKNGLFVLNRQGKLVADGLASDLFFL